MCYIMCYTRCYIICNIMCYMLCYIMCYMMCCRWLPESPRWLYAVGRNKQGDALVRKIAKYNKRTLPEKLEITVIVSKLS